MVAEQRRSPRYECALSVDMIEGKLVHRLQTVNVSRHGIFLETDEPSVERVLVQLLVHLPDGPLNANAVVSRTVRTPELSGIGVQFFAQSTYSKKRWDDFVFALAGKFVTPGHDKQSWSTGAQDRATFLIKLKDKKRLEEFRDRNVARGGLYMATPVIKEAGATVALIIIHPVSEQEYLLTGRVERVCLEVPKGMEISFPAMDKIGAARFSRFIETGQGPEAVLERPEGVAPPPPPPRPQARPRDPTPLARAPSVRDKLPLAFQTESHITDDFSIDITVDTSALGDSAQFGWEDVGVEDMVIDFDVNDPTDDPITREIPTDDLNQGFDSSSHDLMVPIDASKKIKMRLFCKACGKNYGEGEFGALDGPLGLLAARRPYWCAKEDRLVPVVRLNPSAERRAALAGLDEGALDSMVKLRSLFQLADFSRTARCDACGGPTRVNRIVKEVGERESDLASQPSTTLVHSMCPDCNEPGLTLLKLDDG